MKEAFTADELAEIIRELDLPADIGTPDGNESGETIYIESETEFLSWSVDLGCNGPFFTEMTLRASAFIDEEPLAYANNWNRQHEATVAWTFDDPMTGALYQSASGQYVVALKWFVPFYGSVSDDFLAFVFANWNESVCEFNGIEGFDEEDKTETDPSTSEEQLSDQTPIDRLLQIQLELTLRSPQSCRELAKSLKATKYEINYILYHHSGIFLKQGETPPLWSLRKNI